MIFCSVSEVKVREGLMLFICSLTFTQNISGIGHFSSSAHFNWLSQKWLRHRQVLGQTRGNTFVNDLFQKYFKQNNALRFSRLLIVIAQTHIYIHPPRAASKHRLDSILSAQNEAPRIPVIKNGTAANAIHFALAHPDEWVHRDVV